MRFGGKMNCAVEIFFTEEVIYQSYIIDIAMHKTISLGLFRGKIRKISRIACVSQRIQVGDPPAGLDIQGMADEIRADKSIAAGHQKVFGVHILFLLPLSVNFIEAL